MSQCDNFNIIPRHCHSRFCNSCGVKYAKQLAIKATTFCLDTTHRHIVFTIPEELRNWFRQDRTRLDLLFVASRNTMSSIFNKNLARKSRLNKIKNTHYLYIKIILKRLLQVESLNGILTFTVLYAKCLMTRTRMP